MFQLDARHWELIFFLLTGSKWDLGEFGKAMLQWLLCQIELIFDLVTIQNANWLRSKTRCFKGSYGSFYFF